MKKLLLSTSALFGVLALSVSAAQADGGDSKAGALAVNIGGFLDFQGGFADQDLDTGAFSRDYHFANDTEIHFNVGGTSSNGLNYGAVIELEADVNADAEDSTANNNADKTYLFLESNAGRVELGNNVGAQRTMKVDASTIARATGGVDGDWDRFVNTGTAGYILRPSLPSDHALSPTEDATKVTYYTPRASGAQLGVSFTPDNGDSGTAAGFSTDADAGDVENVFGVGLNYTGEANGVGIQASATGEFGPSETAATEDTSAWALGLGADFQGFSVAGSWGDWGDSTQTAGSGDDGSYWTLGAAYENGPYGLSVTYLDSQVDSGASSDDFTNISVGADYQLAPGLVPYVEVSFFELDTAGTASDNEGSVVLVGAQLNF